jgi:uncharacterized protein (DUF305 family)
VRNSLLGLSYALAASIVVGALSPPAPALQSRSGAIFEHQLIHTVIDADRLEVRMAEVCRVRASHEELRDACLITQESRTVEINQLQKWSESWYATTTTEHNDIRKDPKMKKLAAAKKANFDSVFVAQEIAEQELVLSTLNGCEESASHNELKEFCQRVRKSRLEQKQKFGTWISNGFQSSEPGNIRR